MPLRKVTTKSDIREYTERQIENIRYLLVRNLQVIGEKCVNTAKISAMKGRDFKDQTGNLRSSIGYVVCLDGEIVRSNGFDVVKDGREGSIGGFRYAEELAGEYPSGIILIVVAGMRYAQYVAAKGYDVLDSAELLADRLVPQMLEQLGLSY